MDISIGSLIVGASGLLLTIWQGRRTQSHQKAIVHLTNQGQRAIREHQEAIIKLTSEAQEAIREHQRISVRPLLRFADNLQDTTSTPRKYHISLSNEGFGTAIIRSYDLYYAKDIDSEGKPAYKKVNRDFLKQEFGAIFHTDIRTFYVDRGQMKHPIQNGKEIKVIEVQATTNYNLSNTECEKMRNIMNKIGITLCYSSLYKEAWAAQYKTVLTDASKYRRNYPDLNFPETYAR